MRRVVKVVIALFIVVAIFAIISVACHIIMSKLLNKTSIKPIRRLKQFVLITKMLSLVLVNFRKQLQAQNSNRV